MVETSHPERVTFESEEDTLVGHIFRPDQAGTDRALPTVVVIGSWSTVKEQMAGRYARGLAERGYQAFAFDFRGSGESTGVPRDFESPSRKIRDVYNAVTFLRTLPETASGRIGALGICAGAGYAAVGAADDPRIRSLALVAPWLHNAAITQAAFGGAAAVSDRIAAGEEAQEKYCREDAVDYISAAGVAAAPAVRYGLVDYYLNRDRGAVPRWSNRFAVMSWPEWLQFEPIPAAYRITIPTAVVHSAEAAIPEGTRLFYERLAGPKEITWIGGLHSDFYDRDAIVNPALDIVGTHFQATLSREFAVPAGARKDRRPGPSAPPGAPA
jgi:dienelactone hydrolase